VRREAGEVVVGFALPHKRRGAWWEGGGGVGSV